MKIIIMAAGEGKRWSNYLGVPKQLIKINGEPLLLRTIRQLKERKYKDIIVTVPKIGYYGKLPCRQLIGINEVEIDKFLNAEGIINGNALFLWGDTFFTENAMSIILNDKNDLMFFGRKGKSNITGKPWAEIFALKANKGLFRRMHELRGMAGKLKRCASWELYRLINGYPLNRHIVKAKFTEINDFTEDFDYPKDYDIWVSKYNKKKNR